MLKIFRKKKKKDKPLRSIQIQGSVVEGSNREVMLESLLTGQVLNTSVPGTINGYTTYEGQVSETYRKYNSFASFGSQQTRAVVDLRTAFIAGEGVSISCEDEPTALWIEDFIEKNKLNGNNFVNAVKGSEMSGQSLLLMRPQDWIDGSLFIKISRIPYTTKMPYKPVYDDPLLRENVIDVLVKRDGVWVSFGFTNFVYVRTGGDDVNDGGPVTKVGVILTDMENYDRAIKDMRRNNHIFARITPTFKTENDAETTALQAHLNEMKWQIGTAFIGSAEMDYKSPSAGAHAVIESELKATIKTISSVSGVPVHWLGFVDLMSNRSTAETLYELIKNATINERVEWQNAAHNMILKSQELYIDNGGTELPALNSDFQVFLPLIDFGNFLERIRGYNLARSDGAISMDDYRNAIPGIDPLKTKRAIEKEKEDAEKEMVRMGIDPKLNLNLEDDNEEDEDE